MSLPLQPDLHPWPPTMRRIAAVLALALAVLVVGVVTPARRQPPELLLGGPGREGDYARTVERMITSARQRCWVAMYVVRPDDGVVGGLLDALVAAKQRGVEVRVLLDLGQPRDGVADDKHREPEAWLRQHGIDVVLDEAATTTHAKVVVVDGRSLVLGSFNWTRSALLANREAGVRIDDPLLAREVEDWLRAVPGWVR